VKGGSEKPFEKRQRESRQIRGTGSQKKGNFSHGKDGDNIAGHINDERSTVR